MVVGSSTVPIASFVVGTSSGVGGAIVSIGGFGTAGTSATGPSGDAVFTGVAARGEVRWCYVWLGVWLAGLGAWLV